ncbi:hypothetical protein Lal_00023675 [Lupinus albus]|nr:hypothetical protein Lal_00023675 [Lupinus albus]
MALARGAAETMTSNPAARAHGSSVVSRLLPLFSSPFPAVGKASALWRRNQPRSSSDGFSATQHGYWIDKEMIILGMEAMVMEIFLGGSGGGGNGGRSSGVFVPAKHKDDHSWWLFLADEEATNVLQVWYECDTQQLCVACLGLLSNSYLFAYDLLCFFLLIALCL